MAKVKQAWELAQRVHYGQKRNDGVTDYIHHCRDVVKILLEWGYGKADNAETIICSAILHDCIEDAKDKDAVREEIAAVFGGEIYAMVEALSKEEQQAYDNYINVIMSFDNVPIIKIADIIVNLSDNPKEEKKKIYRESIVKLLKPFVGE